MVRTKGTAGYAPGNMVHAAVPSERKRIFLLFFCKSGEQVVPFAGFWREHDGVISIRSKALTDFFRAALAVFFGQLMVHKESNRNIQVFRTGQHAFHDARTADDGKLLDPQMNEALMKKTGLKKGGAAYKLISGILPSFILNTFNTAIVSAANIFYNPEIPAETQPAAWGTGFLHDWPIMFVLSYIAAFVSEIIAAKVADAYTEQK